MRTNAKPVVGVSAVICKSLTLLAYQGDSVFQAPLYL